MLHKKTPRALHNTGVMSVLFFSGTRFLTNQLQMCCTTVSGLVRFSQAYKWSYWPFRVSLTDVRRPEYLLRKLKTRESMRGVGDGAALWVIYALCSIEKGMSDSVSGRCWLIPLYKYSTLTQFKHNHCLLLMPKKKYISNYYWSQCQGETTHL